MTREMTLADIAKAYEISGLAHRKQIRKGNKEPYANHPIRVAYIVASDGGSAEEVITAALHDVMEDTKHLTWDELRDIFGETIEELVAGVTDDPSMARLPRRVRKEMQAKHYTNADMRVQRVKLGDQIDNLESLRATLRSRDPEDARDYAECMILVARACAPASEALAARAERAFDNIMDALGMNLGKESEFAM